MRGCGAAASDRRACGVAARMPSRIKLEGHTKRPPIGNQAGRPNARNRKLGDWVSGPNAQERTFQLSGFHCKP